MKSKSGLFLIELIISILFFSLGSIVCIQMFVASYVTAEDSARLTSAVVAAQSAAEIYKSGGSELLAQKTAATLEDGGYHASFDESGAFIPGGRYDAVFVETKGDDLYMLTIELYHEGERIYDLKTVRFQKEGQLA